MEGRGSVSVLVAGLMIMLTGVALGAIRVTEAVILRQGAQTAADAAALGAARGLDPNHIAARNGATVVKVTPLAGAMEVEVVRRGARARARAGIVAREGTGAAGLDPRIAAAMARAEALAGRPIPVSSGLRSRAQQEALWAARAANPYPVAPPGSSMHERGLAVDVSEADAALVESLHVGLCRPYANDPVHLELC